MEKVQDFTRDCNCGRVPDDPDLTPVSRTTLPDGTVQEWFVTWANPDEFPQPFSDRADSGAIRAGMDRLAGAVVAALELAQEVGYLDPETDADRVAVDLAFAARVALRGLRTELKRVGYRPTLDPREFPTTGDRLAALAADQLAAERAFAEQDADAPFVTGGVP